jgi:Site-specific recombinase XerD
MAPVYETWVQQFLDHLLIFQNSSAYTVQAYQSDLHQLADYLREHVPEFEAQGWPAISTDHLRRYQAYLVERGYANSTIARKLTSVRSFFKFLLAEEQIPQNPASTLESPGSKHVLPKAITVEAINRLLNAPTQVEGPVGLRDQAILELLYATGMRVSELSGLRLEDVNLERNTVLCRGKRNREREIPFHELAAQKLMHYLKEGRPQLVKGVHPNDAVFLNYRGTPLTRQGIWLIIRKYARLAGIEVRVSPHVLRHSVATHLLRSGANLREVQELLGHVNMSTTQRYTKVVNEHLRDVYEETHPRA